MMHSCHIFLTSSHLDKYREVITRKVVQYGRVFLRVSFIFSGLNGGMSWFSSLPVFLSFLEREYRLREFRCNVQILERNRHHRLQIYLRFS